MILNLRLELDFYLRAKIEWRVPSSIDFGSAPTLFQQWIMICNVVCIKGKVGFVTNLLGEFEIDHEVWRIVCL